MGSSLPSTPNLNRSASTAPQGAESDHSPAQAEATAKHRPDQTALAVSHGYGDSPETEGIQASDSDRPLVPDALRAERRRSNQLDKEIRSLKQQLNRFSGINPEE
jgi:hypothetical protein